MTWLEDNWLRLSIALSSFVTSGAALKFLHIYLQNRTANKTLDLNAEDTLNKHYAAELAALREQVVKTGDSARARAEAAEKRHMEAQIASDERFDRAMKASAEREQACEDRVSELRDEVRTLSDEIAGLRKNVGQSGRAAIVLASQVPSLTIQEAADRAATALGDADERLHSLPHSEGPPP